MEVGDDGGGHLVRMEWRLAGWSVCLPLLIFPCTIKPRSSPLAPAIMCWCAVKKLLTHSLTGTGSPGWSRRKAVKWLWCVYITKKKKQLIYGPWYLLLHILVKLSESIIVKMSSCFLSQIPWLCQSAGSTQCVQIFHYNCKSCSHF